MQHLLSKGIKPSPNCGSGTGSGNGSLGDGSDGHCGGGDDGSECSWQVVFFKRARPTNG